MSKNTNTNLFWLRFHRHQRRKTYHITVWHNAVGSYCSAIWTTGSRCRRPPHCHWWNRRTGTCCWRRIRYKEHSTVSEIRELWYHRQYVSTLSEHAAAKNRGVRGPSLRRLARRRHYLLPHVQVLPELRRVLRVHSEEEGREEARSSVVRPETDSHADCSSKNASWYLMVLQVRSDHLAWEWHKAKTVRTMRIEALGSSSGEIHLRCRSWGGDKLDVSDKLLTVWRVSSKCRKLTGSVIGLCFNLFYLYATDWVSDGHFSSTWDEQRTNLCSFQTDFWVPYETYACQGDFISETKRILISDTDFWVPYETYACQRDFNSENKRIPVSDTDFWVPQETYACQRDFISEKTIELDLLIQIRRSHKLVIYLTKGSEQLCPGQSKVASNDEDAVCMRPKLMGAKNKLVDPMTRVWMATFGPSQLILTGWKLGEKRGSHGLKEHQLICKCYNLKKLTVIFGKCTKEQ